MPLDAYEYQDPLDVLIAREARTCKGCGHHRIVWAWGERHERCAINRRVGSRCRSYHEQQPQPAKETA